MSLLEENIVCSLMLDRLKMQALSAALVLIDRMLQPAVASSSQQCSAAPRGGYQTCSLAVLTETQQRHRFPQ